MLELLQGTEPAIFFVAACSSLTWLPPLLPATFAIALAALRAIVWAMLLAASVAPCWCSTTLQLYRSASASVQVSVPIRSMHDSASSICTSIPRAALSKVSCADRRNSANIVRGTPHIVIWMLVAAATATSIATTLSAPSGFPQAERLPGPAINVGWIVMAPVVLFVGAAAKAGLYILQSISS